VANEYEDTVLTELDTWRQQMQRKPGITGRLSRSLQARINSYIPEKVHKAITAAFKQVVGGMLAGSRLTNAAPLVNESLRYREALVKDRISFYRNTAAAEGAITGAGGFLSSLADFPIWLGIKMKMLSEIAALYGHDLSDLNERLYLLYTFQLCFSERKHRRKVYQQLATWAPDKTNAPGVSEMDWRAFQQEYRDYIDLAKLIQMIPGIGAVAGAVVNHRLTDKLGHTAMNAYRMRWFEEDNRGGLTPQL
jgi:hypothetical protein